jgi:hypothetical protein
MDKATKLKVIGDRSILLHGNLEDLVRASGKSRIFDKKRAIIGCKNSRNT